MVSVRLIKAPLLEQFFKTKLRNVENSIIVKEFKYSSTHCFFQYLVKI